jgi:bla regulator protein blaR1
MQDCRLQIAQTTRARTMRRVSALASVFFFLAPALPQTPPAGLEFEVASVKRNISGSRPWLVPPVGGRFTATNVALSLLIRNGWRWKIVGAPSWVDTEGYDVSAIAPRPDITPDDFSLMMRNLLKERFGLRVHTETREARVYFLLPAKTGLKLPNANPAPCFAGLKPQGADPQDACAAMSMTRESITDERVSMEWFAGVLEGVLGRPVRDKTGFTGSFQVHLEYAPVALGTANDTTKPSIFTALEEQLGLRLESQKGSEEVLVIDHVERPSEN